MKFKFSIVFLFSEMIETDLQFCIKSDTKNSRKMYGDGESCQYSVPITIDQFVVRPKSETTCIEPLLMDVI